MQFIISLDHNRAEKKAFNYQACISLLQFT